MEVRAVSKYVRISPTKVRMVVGAVKGKPVETGLNALKFMPQKAASIVEKTIRSAVANAEQNADLDVDQLVIRNITADQGPTLKRLARQGSRQRYADFEKNQSHYRHILADEPEAAL